MQINACSQKGFTLIEVMIYASLTAIIIGLFGGILITATRIQGQQSSSAKVTQELSFLMNSIKRIIHSGTDFSLVGANEITVVVDLDTIPPTTKKISWSAETKAITLTEVGPGGQQVSTLSSAKSVIDNLTFTESSNGASKVVRIEITASASTTNPQQAFTRSLQSSAGILLQEQ
jgi:type II secretory pathway pseudopilin PulG